MVSGSGAISRVDRAVRRAAARESRITGDGLRAGLEGTVEHYLPASRSPVAIAIITGVRPSIAPA